MREFRGTIRDFRTRKRRKVKEIGWKIWLDHLKGLLKEEEKEKEEGEDREIEIIKI